MLIKLASYALAGSVTALTVAGVLNLDDRHFGYHGGPRVEIRRHIRNDIRNEMRYEVRRRQPRRERRASHDEAEARIEGTYAFDASGNPLGKLPWSAHVELSLEPEGRYELRVKMDVNGEGESETSWGRYRKDGDRLVLYSPSDSDETEFVIDGERLVFDADWTERFTLKAVGIMNPALVRMTQ